ncbi:MAG: hypothetical protein ACXV7J_10185 [Methylomonas sp.]
MKETREYILPFVFIFQFNIWMIFPALAMLPASTRASSEKTLLQVM